MMRPNFQENTGGTGGDMDLRGNWQEVRKYTASLWEHWIDAYLPSILGREKWIDVSLK